jgi:protein O-mannosyl-transferase
MNASRKYTSCVIVLFIVLVTALTFAKSLNSDFVKLDDPTLCYDNPIVKNFSTSEAFSTEVAQDYIPITFMSFALDHALFGFNPFYFHLHNLILHLVNVALVFYLLFLLTEGNLFIAAFVSLLFGVHPMHVESVMWVSQRKDVLSGLFYLLSLIVYIKFLNKKNILVYFISFTLFGLALLTKFMAVTLPAAILLIAVYKKETFKNTIKQMLPYLALMGGLAYVHLQLHNAGAMASEAFNWLSGAQRGISSLAFYVSKLTVPLSLSPFYQQNVTTVNVFDWFLLLGYLAASV